MTISDCGPYRGGAGAPSRAGKAEVLAFNSQPLPLLHPSGLLGGLWRDEDEDEP
jgi:hypothetical protein